MTQKAIGHKDRWVRRLASSLAALALMFTVGLAVDAHAAVILRNPDVPFPLEAQLPFPWATIEGMWEANLNGVSALYSFQVQTDGDERKVLKVIQLDPATYAVIAEGTGISSTDDKKMTAAMKAQGGAYLLSIRAYKDTKAKIGPKVATVLTVRPFTGTEEDEKHVIIRKVSHTPYRIPRGSFQQF